MLHVALRSLSRYAALLAMVGVFGTSASALAQQSHVSGMGLDWGAWHMKPIYCDTTAGPHVQSFLALAKADTTSGSNIVAVWYIRDTTDPTLWTSKSWTTLDAAEAVKSVKISMGIPDSEDPNWQLDEPLEVLPGQTPEEAKDYSKGILVDDPLYPIVAASTDHTSLVQMLKDIGYSVADVTIEHAANCESAVLLTDIAIAFEWGIAQPITTEAEEAAASEGTNAMMTVLAACQAPPPPCTPSVGAWTNGAVTAGPCNWVYTSQDVVTRMGGYNHTCNYEARKYFRQTRTATATRSDCTTYTCTQIRIGYAAAAGSCTSWYATGTPLPACPTPPSCLGNPPAATSCSATAPTTWGPWGPPCNPQ